MFHSGLVLRNELSLNKQFLNLFKQVLKPKWPQTTTLTFLKNYILTSPTYWDPKKIQPFGTTLRNSVLE